MSKLSIIITTLNDPDLPETLRSIRETTEGRTEVIIVSDGAPLPKHAELLPSGVRGIVNSRRIGVGPSRTLGALNAGNDLLLICDSHMRFLPGWYEKAMNRIADRPYTLHCATCLGLDSEAMDPAWPKSKYYGATIRLFGPDTNNRARNRVLESVWNPTPPEDDAEICAPMGAAYFWPRSLFLELNPLEHLKSWGSDETAMAIKIWMSGGEVRLMRNVEIGHVFLRGNEKQPFTVPVGHVAFNKLWIIETMLWEDPVIYQYLHEKMLLVYGGGELTEAKKILAQHWASVEVERVRNRSRFNVPFSRVIQKFKLL